VVGCDTPEVEREKAAVPQPSETAVETAAPRLVTPVAAQGATPAAGQSTQNTAQEDGSSDQRSVYLGSIDEEPVAALAAPDVVEVDGRTLEIKGRLPKDAIPSIDEPTFLTAGETDSQMTDEALVIGLSVNDEHRAYSVAFLSRHEIVNDVVGGVPVAVTY
jgi:hypothetical protein